jgi:hypothetical protein
MSGNGGGIGGWNIDGGSGQRGSRIRRGDSDRHKHQHSDRIGQSIYHRNIDRDEHDRWRRGQCFFWSGDRE